MKRQRTEVDTLAHPLPELRFEISEAARILRMSRAQLYNRIQQGSINPQKDGARTYLTRTELERYVNACMSCAPRTTGYADH
jgi:Helix-turn-helix domain